MRTPPLLAPQRVNPPLPEPIKAAVAAAESEAATAAPAGAGLTTKSATKPVLPAGGVGKVGVLDLHFALAANQRTTVLRSRFGKAPLVLTRPLYCDPDLPQVPISYVMSTGAGLAQGDRQRIDITVTPGAHALITTQAATKVHRMDHGYALSQTHLTCETGSLLEWIPDPVISYGNSRGVHLTTATLAPGAGIIMGECYVAGRLARDEVHAYDVLATDTRISRRFLPASELTSAAVPIAIERNILRPTAPATAPLISREYPVWASLWIIPPNNSELTTESTSTGDSITPLLDRLQQFMADAHLTSGGDPISAPSYSIAAVGRLPHNAGVWVRILSHNAHEAQNYQHQAWSVARQQLLGVKAPDLRKY